MVIKYISKKYFVHLDTKQSHDLVLHGRPCWKKQIKCINYNPLHSESTEMAHLHLDTIMLHVKELVHISCRAYDLEHPPILRSSCVVCDPLFLQQLESKVAGKGSALTSEDPP